MRILVTSFEPFDSDTSNASQEAMCALPSFIAGAEVVKETLPVIFGKSLDCLRQAMDIHRPDVVICMGQATGRYGITPERVAINVMDARIPDNQGEQPTDSLIAPDGPAAYFSTLPIEAMVSAMQQAGIPSSVSNSAGTYVCNQVMYGLMHIISSEHLDVVGGFVHVPCTPMQAAKKKNVASMAVNDVVRGLTVAIETIVRK